MVQTGVQEQNWLIELLLRVFVPTYLKANGAFVTKHENTFFWKVLGGKVNTLIKQEHPLSLKPKFPLAC